MSIPSVPFRREKPWETPGLFFSGLWTFAPDECGEILATRNRRNRSLNAAHVDYLAGQMIAGQFRVNGEPVIFDRDGELADGQHRLAASARSGVPFQSVLVVGIDPSAFPTIDCGRARTLADVLGISGEQSCSVLASLLNLIWLDDRNELHTIGSGTRFGRVPHAELMATLEAHPEARDSADWCSAVKRKAPFVLPRILAYCHWKFRRIDAAAAEAFLGGLVGGAGLDAGTPVLALRNRLIENAAGKAKLPPREVLALCLKAWNHTRTGTPIRFLRWRADGPAAEPFPTPI